VKKAVIFLLFALGCVAITGNIFRYTASPKQLPSHGKELCYSITSDSQSPVELKQVNILPSAAGGHSFNQKITAGLFDNGLLRVVLKYRTSRYPLHIKDLAHGPVFLRNRCLRI
jgi:hypothetical protein